MKIIQLSDIHLLQHSHAKLRGLDTEQTFLRVLELLKQETDIGMLLLTGDLSEDGSAQAYQRLANYIKDLNYPTYWIPGNHDDNQVLSEFLVGKNISTQRAFDYLTWRIILLNSLKQGAVSGELATCELDFLKQQLDQHQKSILIALHHHPVPVASKMIDQYPLENATELWDIVSNYPQVKLILSGHVHQEFRQRVGHVEVLTCPSTCMQFAPHAEKLQFDSLAPGYRWIELQPQGAYQTGIVRISPYLNWQNYIYD